MSKLLQRGLKRTSTRTPKKAGKKAGTRAAGKKTAAKPTLRELNRWLTRNHEQIMRKARKNGIIMARSLFSPPPAKRDRQCHDPGYHRRRLRNRQLIREVVHRHAAATGLADPRDRQRRRVDQAHVAARAVGRVERADRVRATEALTSASHKLAEVMYQNAGANAGGSAGAGPTADSTTSEAGNSKADDVIDAEVVDEHK